MKKVAHIFTVGGSYKILGDKLQLLQEKGYEIETISSKSSYRDEFEKYDFNKEFIEMSRSISPVADLISIFKMYKLLKRKNYDIVHTHTAKAGVIGRVAAWLADVPIIIHTAHGLPFFEGQSNFRYHLYRLFEKVGSWFCDAIGSQNKDDLAKIKDYSPRQKVYYEGNGVDLPALDQKLASISGQDLKQIKDKWNISEDKKVILMAARFESVKNHQFLLAGLKQLVANYDIDFICLLAGKGYLKEEIESQIKEYNLEGQVKIIGYQTNIFSYIKLADIVTLTSKKEGVPRIIMESMAFSKPIVATDVLGTRDVVSDNQSGYLVQLGARDSLAEALNDLLNNVEKRKDFGQRAREVIEEEFTEQIVVERIDKLYKELLDDKN
ncbi:glycosyltransferase family 4 protein [Natroniella sulfidigena]|uniref:glycosyltransferase family 4 protein n=1 Tax=Natroniella sulfidigena TaxID=723921 RepID=UPI00200B3B3D|nr:glycosyltransferase family 4 protein [Natroniella sulfidigena]MCK8816299.1 glycosyltransferase family 4 protein [Natroniella sulfidigena]